MVAPRLLTIFDSGYVRRKSICTVRPLRTRPIPTTIVMVASTTIARRRRRQTTESPFGPGVKVGSGASANTTTSANALGTNLWPRVWSTIFWRSTVDTCQPFRWGSTLLDSEKRVSQQGPSRKDSRSISTARPHSNSTIISSTCSCRVFRRIPAPCVRRNSPII